ncbi:MAG: glycogen synthase GlgA [Planctomycetaceae bacterium]|nr:glycogen synthase GlgA [Planctomycetaceae bacterium]
MQIIFSSSEAAPFSKTGGLADVASSLPKALSQAGHQVALITPYYPQERRKWPDWVPPPEVAGPPISIGIGSKTVSARVLQTSLPNSKVMVYLVDQPDYFDRPGIYQDGDRDYKDNCERFVFLSRATIEIARRFGWQPDIVHTNDWQTALVPALLKIECGNDPTFQRTASVFTIHNLAFQGQFWHWDMHLTGLDWKYFNWRQMEFFGNLNLLKSAVVFTDMVTTVSPTYAREIQTPEFGCGLNGVLSSRRDDLVGILNGVDTEVWNPAIDEFIAAKYKPATVSEGKPACKAALQQRMGLPVRSEVPLLGMVSRMTGQKGCDIISECAADFLKLDLQAVFLGSGDPGYEQFLQRLAHDNPQKVAVQIGYNEPLSHQIEAGADIFLMPSQYEPCGLNQMYSLLYGTVPIVRAVGGLADSVVDAWEQTLANGTANGFSFHEYRGDVLLRQICRAIGLFQDKATWNKLMQTGMQRDWSWRRSAREYEQVYQRAQAKRHAPAHG